MKKKEHSYAVRRRTINIVLACVLAIGLVGLAGCGQQGAENGAGTQGGSGSTEQPSESEESEESEKELDESALRSDFTEEELADGQADFQVSEHLYVDAEVTPADVYAGGVASYYLETFYEDGTQEEFAAHPQIFGQAQEDFFATLSDVLGVSITADLLDYMDDEETQQIVESTDLLPADNGASYRVGVVWKTDEALAGRYASKSVVNTFSDDASLDDINTVMGGCERYLSPDEKEGLLLTDDELAVWRETIGELTGRIISGFCDGIHVTEENVLAISEINSLYEGNWLDWKADPADGYYFYYDLDGLLIDVLSLTYALDPDDPEPCADDVEVRKELSQLRGTAELQNLSLLHAKDDRVQELVTDGTHMMGLYLCNRYQAGEVYREAQPVLSPSVPLEAVEAYYPEEKLTADVTVTQVRLVYAAYFTDPADGEIRNAYCPFWKVVVYDENLHENRMFVFDAVSGDILVQEEELPQK